MDAWIRSVLTNTDCQGEVIKGKHLKVCQSGYVSKSEVTDVALEARKSLPKGSRNRAHDFGVALTSEIAIFWARSTKVGTLIQANKPPHGLLERFSGRDLVVSQNIGDPKMHPNIL